MLTKKRISELRDYATELNGLSLRGADVIDALLDEIEAQRPVVLEALNCTGEDGHDSVVNLVCVAEEYLDKLIAADPSWRTEFGTANVDRKTY
jgi:hypothetical protein